MNRERRKIFGQMLVDVVKYLFTVIVIGSIFADTVKVFPIIIGLMLAIIIASVAYKLIPHDEKED
jgi:hypothetical protein